MSEIQTSKVIAHLYTAKVVAAVQPIGSYHAFGEGEDIDFVVLSTLVTKEDAADALVSVGYVLSSPDGEGSGGGSDAFIAMRKGDFNLLVTDDHAFYIDSKTAFEVVCALNLTDKADRIKVHQIIVDGGLHD